jgi:hypothetical protein
MIRSREQLIQSMGLAVGSDFCRKRTDRAIVDLALCHAGQNVAAAASDIEKGDIDLTDAEAERVCNALLDCWDVMKEIGK